MRKYQRATAPAWVRFFYLLRRAGTLTENTWARLYTLSRVIVLREEKRKTEKGREGTQRKAEKGVISRQGRESSGPKDRGQGRKNIMPCGEKGRQGRKKEKRKMTRLGVVGIVIERPCKEVAGRVQALLSDFADIITGRMGVPDKESGVNAIAVIVKGSVERISALSGKLGKLEGVCIKTALTSAELPE